MRQQTFPADRRPWSSTSTIRALAPHLDTILRAPAAPQPGPGFEIERYRKDYCISDAFLAELDKRAGTAEASAVALQERRISYDAENRRQLGGPDQVLQQLTIDAGGDRLISFCADPLKPASPTGNEFTATDFKPDRDLNIHHRQVLIIRHPAARAQFLSRKYRADVAIVTLPAAAPLSA